MFRCEAHVLLVGKINPPPFLFGILFYSVFESVFKRLFAALLYFFVELCFPLSIGMIQPLLKEKVDILLQASRVFLPPRGHLTPSKELLLLRDNQGNEIFGPLGYLLGPFFGERFFLVESRRARSHRD